MALHHHVGKPRVQWQAHHLLAHGGDLVLRVQRLKPLQQVLCLGEGGGGRRVEPGQRLRIGDAPGGELQHQGCKVGDEDFRIVMGLERARFGLGPQAIADARAETSRAATALVGTGERHAHGFKRRHARCRIETRHALEAAVDDRTDAVDGEARLGNRGGQHDLAFARG